MASALAKRRMNPWLLLAFAAIPVFVGSLDLTVVSAFLPELLQELDIPLESGLDSAAWIVSGYLLAYTISLIFMGPLSDRVGRRRVYAACLFAFAAGSVIVAAAHQGPSDWLYALYRRLGQRPDPALVNLQVIIFGRVVQALGAGALVPVTLAFVGDLFPPQQRARPLGLVAAIDTLGWVLGHLYGGLFVQVMPWQGLFWLNVPLTLLALAAVLWGLRALPARKADAARGRFDFLGTALIIAALSCLNLGLGANLEFDAGSFENLAPLPDYAAPLLLAALGFLLVFVWVESRADSPLIDLRLFRVPGFAFASLVNLAVGYALFIGLVSVPILVNVRLDSAAGLQAAALEAGLLLSTLTVPMALAALPGGWLSERIGIRAAVLLGLCLALVGFVGIGQSWQLDTANGVIALQMALVGVGIGLGFAPLSAVIINAAGEAERGAAAALVIILRLIGMTLSVSSLTTYGLYRVNELSARLAVDAGFDAASLVDVYARTTVQVLREMGFIGAAVCVGALLLSWGLVRRG